METLPIPHTTLAAMVGTYRAGLKLGNEAHQFVIKTLVAQCKAAMKERITLDTPKT